MAVLQRAGQPRVPAAMHQAPAVQGYTVKQPQQLQHPLASHLQANTPRPMVHRPVPAPFPYPSNQVCSSRGGSMSVQSFAASSMSSTPQVPTTPQHAWSSSLSAVAVSSTPGNSIVVGSACSGLTTPTLASRTPHTQSQVSTSLKHSNSQVLSQTSSQPSSPKGSLRSVPTRPPARKLVGAPFEKSPGVSPRGSRGSSLLAQAQKAVQHPPPSPAAASSSAKAASSDCGDLVSPSDRRTTAASSRISGATWTSRTSRAGAALRRCRSASLGTRSVDSGSWEADSMVNDSGSSRRRRRSPRSPASRSRLSVGALSALGSESLEKERQAVAKSLQRQHRWLRRALSEEMRRVTEMQEHHQAERDIQAEREERRQQAETRMQQRSSRHWDHSCQKKREQEMRREQDSRAHKDAFEQNRTKLEEDRQSDEQRLTDLREKQRREAEKRLETLADLEAKREAERQRQDQLWKQSEELEQARSQALREQSAAHQQLLQSKKEARELRFQRSAEANQQLEAHRRNRAEEKMRQQQLQENLLAERQRREQEKAQEHASTVASKRQGAKAFAQRRQEDRRTHVAEKVVVKCDKAETLASERQKLWDLRKEAQREAQKVLKTAKAEVLQQAVKSRYCLRWLEEQLERMQNPTALAPGARAASPSALGLGDGPQLLEAEDRLCEQRAAGVDPGALHLQG